jgi:hypothetical protein
MSFEHGIWTEALRAKSNHPGFDKTIDRVMEDFRTRQAKREFEGWDWNMIAEDFHKAVERKCVRVRSFQSGKRGGK